MKEKETEVSHFLEWEGGMLAIFQDHPKVLSKAK